MPKATIHENGNAGGWKHKVRFADEVDSTTPTSNALLSENSDESKLSGKISPTFDSGHNFRSLGFRKDVSQVLPLARMGFFVGDCLGHSAHSQEVTS